MIQYRENLTLQGNPIGTHTHSHAPQGRFGFRRSCLEVTHKLAHHLMPSNALLFCPAPLLSPGTLPYTPVHSQKCPPLPLG